MKDFLSRWIALAVAAGVMVWLLPGMRPVGKPAALGVVAFALFMALLDASIKPTVQLLSLPLTFLTFGVFALVLNWLFMRLASWLAVSAFGVGVFIDGFWWSVLGSIIMAVVSGIVSSIISD
ncbi:Mycobacterial 4 TMS phage holin, superfamily IV [Bifidobacterium sp. DSM 109958]|uniref:Mycobacterial 4 TMS phage holin, superfamily IV n=1 Tax=Bifidobacterium moraviense TaxID=2675323 RepID=A0A7Y0HYQ8_9BIFI|nr:phage holin family protein [Bifidobacterium sp. DSM 109958]NMM99602.1 Mycobacterial 4 TMS phage holin, superfamily IV [Bifidobacterium sp. DSM 109958]